MKSREDKYLKFLSQAGTSPRYSAPVTSPGIRSCIGTLQGFRLLIIRNHIFMPDDPFDSATLSGRLPDRPGTCMPCCCGGRTRRRSCNARPCQPGTFSRSRPGALHLMVPFHRVALSKVLVWHVMLMDADGKVPPPTGLSRDKRQSRFGRCQDVAASSSGVRFELGLISLRILSGPLVANLSPLARSGCRSGAPMCVVRSGRIRSGGLARSPL